MAKILIIDDEAEFADMVALRLRKTGGFETLVAYDGEKGLDLAKKELPDLIILDVLMPKMDGLDVLKNLRKNKPTSATPVLVLTASATPTTMEKLKSLNVGGYIIKPFEPADLMGKINNLLKK